MGHHYASLRYSGIRLREDTRVIEHVESFVLPLSMGALLTEFVRLVYSLSPQNIRVIAQYYTRIRVPRLARLLDLTTRETEETLSRLVVSGSVYARIDRPAGIVSFRNRKSAEDIMNEWSSDVQKLMSLVEKSWMGMNAALASRAK